MKKLGIGLLVILAILGVGPFLVPVSSVGEKEPSELAGPDSRFLEVEGLSVHYIYLPGREGTGDQPLQILLHGFGANVFSWREVLEPLTEYGPVLAFDRPAFGLTQRPQAWNGRNPYGPENQIDIVEAFRREFSAQTLVLYGNSAGGTIALSYVLISPAVYAGGGAPTFLRPLFNLPQVNHLGPLLARQLAEAGDDFLRSSWYDDRAISPEVFAGYRRPLEIRDWDRALWEFTKASQTADLASRLQEIAVPTLVVTGDTDRIVPPEQSQRLANELPNGVFLVIPQSGHLAHEETPAQFLTGVRQFKRVAGQR